jgi:alginate O-acetyltransferase complex protein AlgI
VALEVSFDSSFSATRFMAWWRPDFLGLLVGVTAVSYAFALSIEATTDEAKRYRVLTIGVTINLLALGYFKYANFGVASLNAALVQVGLEPFEFAHVLLPIGLSFYIFHAISYLVDIYRREAPPARNFVDFAAFIALFPHLVAGPVLRYHLVGGPVQGTETFPGQLLARLCHFYGRLLQEGPHCRHGCALG